MATAATFEQEINLRDPKNFAPVIDLNDLSVNFGKRQILKDSAENCAVALSVCSVPTEREDHAYPYPPGFSRPSAGTAHIFGKDILTDAKQIRSLIGTMPERIRSSQR
jgi:hypothetical protein